MVDITRRIARLTMELKGRERGKSTIYNFAQKPETLAYQRNMPVLYSFGYEMAL